MISAKKKLFVASGIFFVTSACILIFSHTVSGEVAEQNSDTQSDTDMTAVYVSNRNDYTFSKPDSWHVYEIPSMSYARLENFDSRTLKARTEMEQKDYFKIEVVTLPRNNMSLHDWVNKQNTTSYPTPKILETKNVLVSGRNAIYQLEQYGSHISPAIYIEKDNGIYIINPSSSSDKYRAVIDEFINDFEFSS